MASDKFEKELNKQTPIAIPMRSPARPITSGRHRRRAAGGGRPERRSASPSAPASTGPAAPIGGVVGVVIGAVAGGLAGKGAPRRSIPPPKTPIGAATSPPARTKTGTRTTRTIVPPTSTAGTPATNPDRD